MNYQKLINTNIKLLRIKYGLTQEEFAEKIGLSIQGLSNIERNRYQPTSETVDKICKIFHISPVELLLINSNSNKSLITNINALLKDCSTYRLKQIYKIISILKNE
ncbi:helix-turn-helix transcriptional regulator [bacterium]|nr:helix-turn-helix transcriptional regulator [bacterium]